MSKKAIKPVIEIFSNFTKYNADKFLHDEKGCLVDPELKHTDFGQKRMVSVPFLTDQEIMMRDIGCLDSVLNKEIQQTGLERFRLHVTAVWVYNPCDPVNIYQMVPVEHFQVENRFIGDHVKLGEGRLYRGKSPSGRSLEFVLCYLQDPTMPGESFLKLVSGPDNPLLVDKVYGYTFSIEEK